MALKFLLKILKFDKYLFCFATFSLLAAVLSVYTSILLGDVVKSVTVENASFDIFIKSLLIFAGVSFSIDLLEFLSYYTSQKYYPNLGARATEHFYNKIMKNSVDFILENNSGYIASQISKIYGNVCQLLSILLNDILIKMILFTISTIIIGYYVPEVFICIIILSVLFAYLYNKRIDRIKEAYSIHYKNDSKLSGFIVDVVSNILLVKSFNKFRTEDENFKIKLDTVKESDKKCLVENACVVLLGYLLYGSFIIITVGYSAYLVFDKQIEISVFVVLNSLSMRCGQYLINLMRGFRFYKKTSGNISQALELMNKEIDIKDTPNAKKLKLKEASISFKDVNFEYKDGTGYVFKNFSLEIPAKQKLGLVGHSGGGKSSLVKLLQRFYDINSGIIEFDGQDIKDVTQDSLRDKIAYVPQDPSLFSRSVFENIAYAKPKATKEEVYKAAKLANAHEFIEELPKGYDTKVGERGFKLSGGQRQRVAIARAILKDTPIIIMDEATSALDSQSEKLIQESLEKLMKDKTCIVIAHRLSTIKNMDRIVVLKNGEIIQDGSHHALVRKEGVYKKLWNLQYAGLIPEEQN